MLNLAHVPDASNEVRYPLHAWPDGFDARLAVAFARERAALVVIPHTTTLGTSGTRT